MRRLTVPQALETVAAQIEAAAITAGIWGRAPGNTPEASGLLLTAERDLLSILERFRGGGS